MSTLKFAEVHNLVALLCKPTECKGFEQIVDFLNANPIKYALMVNPTIYTSCIEQFWATIKVKTVNEEGQLQALVDRNKVIIKESTIRRDVQLEDAEGVDCLPNVVIFKQLTLMRKIKRKDTKLPQTSVPTSVADEAVNEEMDDSLERDATTATSLYAAHDIGNIFKTQYKETPNEPGSQGTSSSGGLRCQEVMGDTVAQTRSERVSKISNDPLLAGVNTPQSGEDSMKLTELIELYTKLQQRVLDLETTNTTQAMQIETLKRRVKKIEKKQRPRTHKLKKLYKVGSARVESSEDEGLGEEDASKQGRIADIDSNEDIYLVNVHKDKYIFGVNNSDGDEVIVKDAEMLFDVSKDLRAKESAKPKTTIASTRPKDNGLVIHKQDEAPTTTVSLQQPSHVRDKLKKP
uniref:Xylulose kinase-1 n=1 Tax=Tanacetum cinerariifolium TaxID=118510 RepID=A0A6L2L6V1_TANCI|nr:hypothetical protein [Tanacetum cinerariifolium]